MNIMDLLLQDDPKKAMAGISAALAVVVFYSSYNVYTTTKSGGKLNPILIISGTLCAFTAMYTCYWILGMNPGVSMGCGLFFHMVYGMVGDRLSKKLAKLFEDE